MKIYQLLSMAVFFGCHAVEDGRTVWIFAAQIFGVSTVYARIVFFGRDGESDYFLFCQIIKTFAV